MVEEEELDADEEEVVGVLSGVLFEAEPIGLCKPLGEVKPGRPAYGKVAKRCFSACSISAKAFS
jgi:hypothetical protein